MRVVEECHSMEWMKQLISKWAGPAASGLGKGTDIAKGTG